MVWIFIAFAVLLLFASPAIRKIGLGILGLGLVIFLAIVIWNRRPVSPPTIADRPSADSGAASRKFDFDKYQQEKKDREDPDAAVRIGLSEVRFDQIQVVPGIEPGTIQTIRARLYNDSNRFTLTDYAYYLDVQDCLPAKSDDRHPAQCTTVFDQRDSVSATVPPNQARDVVIDIRRDPKTLALPFKLLGEPHVEIKPTSTRAYVTAAPG